MQNFHETESRRVCSAPLCSSYCSSNNNLHKFPLHDEALCLKWKEKLKIEKPITKHLRICRLHFQELGYKHDNARRLRKRRRSPVQSEELDPLEIKNPSEYSESSKIESIDNHLLIDEPAVEDFKNDNKFEVCYLNVEDEKSCEMESSDSILETNNARGNVQLSSPQKITIQHKSNPYCCVPGCRANRYKNPYLSFHRFPTKNGNQVYIENRFGVTEKMDRFEAWKMKLNITKHEFANSTLVCSLHFKKEDFILPDVPCKRKRLKRTAVPSLYLQPTPYGRNRGTKEKVKRGKSMKSRERTDTCNQSEEEHTLDPVELCEISCENGLDDTDEVPPNARHKCRICLSTRNLTLLTKYDSLLALFVDITNIEVQTDDELQKYICIDCIQKLEDISHFISMAKKNDEELKRTVLVDKRTRPDDKKIHQKITSNVRASDSKSIKKTFLKSNGKKMSNSDVIRDMRDNNSNSSPLTRDKGKRAEVTDKYKDIPDLSPENPNQDPLSNHSEDQESIGYACWKCGAFIVGVTVPKALENVPPSKIKFQCSTCSKSSESCNEKSVSLNDTISSSVKETVPRRVYAKKTPRGRGTTMRCNTCFEDIPLSEFVRHQLRKHALSGQYKCKECPSRFSHPKSLTRHTNSHHHAR